MNGESHLLHYFGLADPTVGATATLRFAGMYIGEDAEAQNWEPGP